jgi:alpha-L-rhamnosidase
MINRPASGLSAHYFRKKFKAGKHATASIIGPGLYELYLNGQRVGDQVLTPGPTTTPRVWSTMLSM